MLNTREMKQIRGILRSELELFFGKSATVAEIQIEDATVPVELIEPPAEEHKPVKSRAKPHVDPAA